VYREKVRNNVTTMASGRGSSQPCGAIVLYVLYSPASTSGAHGGRSCLHFHPPFCTVDPIVFLAEAEDPSMPRLEVGQMRRVRVDGASLFDLDATVVE
jgi:hypothetical protein